MKYVLINRKMIVTVCFFYLPCTQGVLVQQNTKIGIIANHKALILQKVKRHMAGNYTCIASSVEGDGKSNTVQLRVMCKSFSILLALVLARYVFVEVKNLLKIKHENDTRSSTE